MVYCRQRNAKVSCYGMVNIDHLNVYFFVVADFFLCLYFCLIAVIENLAT